MLSLPGQVRTLLSALSGLEGRGVGASTSDCSTLARPVPSALSSTAINPRTARVLSGSDAQLLLSERHQRGDSKEHEERTRMSGTRTSDVSELSVYGGSGLAGVTLSLIAEGVSWGDSRDQPQE